MKKRPYGWRQQLGVGVAILIFVVGAPWAAFELSRGPLLARAAAIGERICRLAVEGRLHDFGEGSSVPGIRDFDLQGVYALRNMAPELERECSYKVREGDLRVGAGASHVLTVASFPICGPAPTDGQRGKKVINIGLGYHQLLQPAAAYVAVLLGLPLPDLMGFSYVIHDTSMARYWHERRCASSCDFQ